MTLKPGEKPAGPLVADANVILSAVAGKAALRVFTESHLEISITRQNLQEVREYLPVMARRYSIGLEILEAQLRLLPLRVHDRDGYRAKLMQAGEIIGKRDPEDVDLVALALMLDAPIWSNDRDLEDTGLRVFTTARLLRLLRQERK